MPKIEISDLDNHNRNVFISISTDNMLKAMADELGMSASRFVELAILSVNPGTRKWKALEKMMQDIDVERQYLGVLRRKITWSEKRKNANKDIENELKNAFVEIVNSDLKGAELDEFLKSKGMTLDVKM